MTLYGLLGFIIICSILIVWFILIKNDEGYKNEEVVAEADMRALRSMLKDVDKIFRNDGLVYWMNGGTLLGAVRHKGVIPWDDDADLYIMSNDENKFLSLKQTLNNNGYDIGHFWGGYKVYPINGKPIQNKLMNAIMNYDYKFPFIDIFLIKQIDDKFVDANESCRKMWPNSYFMVSELYPLKSYEFDGFELMGPNNPIQYLDRLYGKSWRYTAYKTYDHKTESRISKQVIDFNTNKAKQNIDDATKHLPKRTLCIMAIFKNEQNYLEEWLNHHIDQGVSHFYLYSNDPDMNKYPYLKKYTEYITIIPWIDKRNNGPSTIQRQAYEDCIKTYNDECRYLMMLDIDEFIIPILPDVKVIDIINQLDKDNVKAVKVQRYNFGSNGHIHKPQGDVMNNYTKHEKVCSSYKTIANLSFVDVSKRFYGVHDFPFLDRPGVVYNDYLSYRYTGYPNGCYADSINQIPLVINHYFTKSYDEYLKRCELWKNGGVNTVGYRKDCKKVFKENDKNEVSGYDYFINKSTISGQSGLYSPSDPSMSP